MDQWLENLSESSGLNLHRFIEYFSLKFPPDFVSAFQYRCDFGTLRSSHWIWPWGSEGAECHGCFTWTVTICCMVDARGLNSANLPDAILRQHSLGMANMCNNT